MLSISSGLGYCANVNTRSRKKFIELAIAWIIAHGLRGKTFSSDDLRPLATKHGYSKQAARNALLKLEASGYVERKGTKAIPDAKRPVILYRVVFKKR
jgi:hypothetical protein